MEEEVTVVVADTAEAEAVILAAAVAAIWAAAAVTLEEVPSVAAVT